MGEAQIDPVAAGGESAAACKGFDCQDRLGCDLHSGDPETSASRTQTVSLASFSSSEAKVAKRMPRAFAATFSCVPGGAHAADKPLSHLFSWVYRLRFSVRQSICRDLKDVLQRSGSGTVAPKCSTCPGVARRKRDERLRERTRRNEMTEQPGRDRTLRSGARLNVNFRAPMSSSTFFVRWGSVDVRW